MVLNPFFTQGTSSEQNLVQDLINEQLRMYGVDIYYIPRKHMTEKTVIREVVQSKFDSALPIEAYVDNYDAYSGAGDVLSKFGIESKDEVRLIISRERYENYITPLIQGQSNIKLSTRPKGGDLIWFPLDDRLYEIKDIEYAKPYYQLQSLYVYELYCELFQYQDEVIATGIEDIDNELLGDETDGLTEDGISTIQGITQTLTMVGTAVQATATTGVVDGGVRSFTVTNRGGGYGMIPTVEISAAPSGGLTAVGIATMIGGINVCNLNANPRLRSVQSVNVANPGFGYTVAPSVTFRTTDGTGTGAAATTIIGDGIVGVVTITNAGSGYIDSPTITFEDSPPYTGVLYGSWNTHFYISSAGGAVTGSNGSGYSPGTYDLTGGSGTGARLTVTSSSGAITGATSGLSFANGGQNYEVGDVLLIDGGDKNSYIKVGLTTTRSPGPGTTAEGVAIVSAAGTITAIHLTNAGAGYTVAPTVSIAAPPSGSNAGNFAFNEIVTGSTSNTTARVRSWDSDTNVLEVGSVSGSFSAGETLTGSTSGATRVLRTIDKTVDNDPYADNFDIETAADAILDFSEQNPFGIP